MGKVRAVEPCRRCQEAVWGRDWELNDGLCNKCRDSSNYDDYSNDGRAEEQRWAAEQKGYEQNRTEQANWRRR